MKPTITVSGNQQDEIIVFEINANHINGLLDLRIWQEDTREMIWCVDLDYFNRRRIKYGEPPVNFKTFNGGKGSAKQIVPGSGKPSVPLPVGKSFIIAVTAQYDTWTSAASKTFYYSFSISPRGRISAIVPIPFPGPSALTP
jgi:hypothetical protein